MTDKETITEEESEQFIARCRQLTPISCMHLALWACDVLEQTHGCDDDVLTRAREIIAKEVLEDMPARQPPPDGSASSS